MECDPIGTARTPFASRNDAPRQGGRCDVEGTIELDDAFVDGLDGMAVGDGVDVVWWAHRADREVLTLRDGRGVFTTRSPARPNPVCVTPCTVLDVTGPAVRVRGVDMVDGTPVLDLKRRLD